MSFTATDVKELREVTGAGMMDCKKALEETKGDKEKAIDYLRTKGLASAAKKQGRIAAEGAIITIAIGDKGVALEVNCETDFVAKNADFVAFSNQVAKLILEGNFANVEAVNNAKIGSETVQEKINALVLKIGEKIALRRFTKINIAGGFVSCYTHSGKIGVLCAMESTNKNIYTSSDFQDFAKDICLHIAASDTKFIKADEMDEGFKNKEAEIYAAQLREQGKPEQMIPNIVKGKLSKLAAEVCLMEQKFVKNPDMDIKSIVGDLAKKHSCEIKIKQFVKLNLGEGIEKKQDNFVDEVAKMTSSGNN
jgi:elongation factor Ts